MRLLRRRNHGTLGCRDVQRLMQRFVDGELPASQTDLVAEHLRDCERCGLSAEEFSAVKSALRRLRPDLDVDALARLHAYADELTRD